MTADISVVICAYTEARWNDLVAAVTSVQYQDVAPREIIVVVDHNPQLLEHTRNQIPGIVVLENRESRGLAGARNTAVAMAQGAIVAFLDDDAIAAPDWLAQLNTGYDNPEVVGVGGSIQPLWPDNRPGWFPEEFNWVVGCTYRGLPGQSAPVRNFIGANMSFRRHVFAAVRFYSGIGHIGTRPLGGSDPDFCIRVNQRWPQKVLLYEPRARVYHRVSKNRAHWSYFRLRCYNEGLSKSLITQRVGARDALATERKYTFRTLPHGIMRGFWDSIQHSDVAGLARAVTILAGLLITTIGFIMGLAAQRWASLRPARQVP